MSLLSAIAARLEADADFVGASPGGIGAPRRLPKLPATIISIPADPRPQHMKGFQRVRQSTGQVDIYARSEAEAAPLRERAIAILTPADGSGSIRFQRAMVANVRSGAETGQGPNTANANARLQPEIWRESIDFIFTHNG